MNVSVRLQTESQTICSISEVVLVSSPGLVWCYYLNMCSWIGIHHNSLLPK